MPVRRAGALLVVTVNQVVCPPCSDVSRARSRFCWVLVGWSGPEQGERDYRDTVRSPVGVPAGGHNGGIE